MSTRISRLAVVGTGYVGTVVAACFARLGHWVVGVESDPVKLPCLQAGRIPFHEPELAELVGSCQRTGSLRFTGDYTDGLADADAVFLCVGTPSLPDGGADMSAVTRAARSVAQAVRRPLIVVTKSTICVGGARVVEAVLKDTLTGRNGQAVPVALVHNPEFLREGSAIADFLHPDRVVLGSDDAQALRRIADLYRPILQQSFDGGDPACRPGLMCTDVTTAEMVKYASNAFLATKISFINELAGICDRVGADVTGVAAGMGLDRRIGGAFLAAGLGWGGSCFGKDLAALIATARSLGCEPALLTATVEVNARQQDAMLDKITRHLPALVGMRIALLGLAFKPGTDDLRDAPAVGLARRLLALGAEVVAYDPVVCRVPGLPTLAVASDPYTAAEGADAMVLATEWPDFLLLDLARLRARMRGDVFVDGRNVFDHHAMAAAGYRYEGVGRPPAAGIGLGARAGANAPVAPSTGGDLSPPVTVSGRHLQPQPVQHRPPGGAS